MATYRPLPFVAPVIDQSSQQLRLVDLVYQAQLARIQKEQEARLQGAQMWTTLGLQLPQIVNTVEQNRIRQMQAEADITRIDMGHEVLNESAELRLLVSVRDRAHLADVMRGLRRATPVMKVSRVKP